MWNANKFYDVKKANCQHFTQAILNTLGIDINTCNSIPPLVKEYFKKLKKYGVCSMDYVLPPVIQSSFSFKEITFKSHQELDQFWLTVCANHREWVNTDEGQQHDSLLKGFDRAFWIRRSSSQERNPENEPVRSTEDSNRCLCPFNTYESDSHSFFLAESVMGCNYLGDWVPDIPYRSLEKTD